METRRHVGGGESSTEVLHRIQLETERVKRRLHSADSGASVDSSFDDIDHRSGSKNSNSRSPEKSSGYPSHSAPRHVNHNIHHQNHNSNKARTPVESFSDKYIENYRRGQQGVEVVPNGKQVGPEYEIELSAGNLIEDPVPSNQMSNHLKSEHEAFKAR